MSEADAGSARDDDPLVSFERWANLAAQTKSLSREARAERLEEHDIDIEVWERCEMHYLALLGDDLLRGDMARLQRYGAVCAEATQRGRDAPPAEPLAANLRAPLAAPEIAPTPPLAVPTAALPSFLQHRVEPAVPVVAPPPAAAQSPREALAGTALAFEIPSVFRTGALPFKESTLPPSIAAASGPASSRSPDDPRETAVLDHARVPITDTLPFASRPTAQGAAATFPRMPMQTYASLCAERTVFPDGVAAILKKYDLDARACAALDAHWQARLSAHPKTQVEFGALVTQYETWLRQQGRVP
jgi:hypothetical protein